jgi:hypothetical protein
LHLSLMRTRVILKDILESSLIPRSQLVGLASQSWNASSLPTFIFSLCACCHNLAFLKCILMLQDFLESILTPQQPLEFVLVPKHSLLPPQHSFEFALPP